MKNYLILLALMFGVQGYPQTNAPMVPPYIEVTGSAEMAVKPDIYFINLRIVGVLFNGIGSQEKKIGNELIKAGLEATDFSLTALRYDYQRQPPQLNGQVQYKDYVLRIQTKKQLTDVCNALDKAGTQQWFLSGADYTKKDSITKILGVDALRNASNKASTTLSVINRHNAQVLSIVEEFSGPQLFNDELPYRSTFPQQVNGYSDDMTASQKNYESIQFKVRYRVTYSIL